VSCSYCTFCVWYNDCRIYFPDFCQLVLEQLRQESSQEEEFRRALFKVLCGTEPLPTEFRARRYRVERHSISRAEFEFVMRSLPVPVTEQEIADMFECADRNKSGRLSYREFQLMVNSILAIVFPTKLNKSRIAFQNQKSDKTSARGDCNVWLRQVNPPEPPAVARPSASQLGLRPQVFSPPATSDRTSLVASLATRSALTTTELFTVLLQSSFLLSSLQSGRVRDTNKSVADCNNSSG